MHHILDELIDHEELKSHLSIYLKGTWHYFSSKLV